MKFEDGRMLWRMSKENWKRGFRELIVVKYLWWLYKDYLH